MIDECLTVELVTVAGRAGHEAYHVAHLGKAGWKDWSVAQYAWDKEYVLITNNGVDFRKLYATQSLHPGLIVIVPNVDGELQQRLFQGAMEQLALSGEPLNQVLEVNIDDENVTFDLYDLPSVSPQSSE